jgi:hypothetical protein
MIYQCYFKKGQEEKIFKTPVYSGFGLEPEVNSNLFLNCSELKEEKIRLQLTEYACFLWHWRNPTINPDSWFGTTSYRQLDKTPFIFKDKNLIETQTEKNIILGWGFYDLVDRKGNSISLAKQAEVCHPGINDFIQEAFNQKNLTIPKEYYTQTIGLFANYWVMSNKMFDDYMNFSWPLVSWALENREVFDYFKNDMPGKTVTKEKAVGYFMERLFLLWYLKNKHTLQIVGPLMKLYHGC